MKIRRTELLRTLEEVSAGLATRALIEQSNCFAFQDGEVITFNDEVACRKSADFGITGVVQATPLLALLGKLSEEELDIQQTEEELKIKAGKNRRSGIRRVEEVLLPLDSLESPKKWRKLPENFQEAIGVVVSCASTDESQSLLSCVHITSEYLEACDVYQLARYPIKVPVTRSVLIKREAIKHVSQMRAVKVSETDAWFHFCNESGLILSCRTFAEEYPSLDELLEVDGSEMRFPAGLADAVSKAEVFLSESDLDSMMFVGLKKGRLRLRGEGASGWYEERSKVEYDGEPMEFSVSPRLLMDMSKKSDKCIVGESRLKIAGGSFIYVSCMGLAEEPGDE